MAGLRNGALRASLRRLVGRTSGDVDDRVYPWEPRVQRLQRQARLARRRRAFRRAGAGSIALVLGAMGVASNILPGAADNGLSVDPSQGQPGDTVTVAGVGVPPCSQGFVLEFHQSSGSFLVTTPVTLPDATTGDFSVQFRIPTSATTAPSKFVLTCGGDVVAEDAFTVQELVPTLAVDPTSALPGASIRVTGTKHFRCGQVFFFVGGQFADSTDAIDDGAIDVTINVPANAADGTTTVSTSCNEGGTPSEASTEFKVLDPTLPKLTPSPAAGLRGTTFDVVAENHLGECDGPVTVVFDGTVVGSGTPDEFDTFTVANVPVPADASAGAKAITSHCANDGSGPVLAETSFTVLIPSLTLTPDTGQAGSTYTVDGLDHRCSSGSVLVFFEGTLQGTAANAEDGSFQKNLTVPAVAPGEYTVSTQCQALLLLTEVDVVNLAAVAAPNALAEATFTVVLPPPALFANPSSGVGGTAVTLSGTNHGACGGTAFVRFDQAPLGSAPVTNGAFTTQVTVPAGATAGPHQFSSACSEAGAAVASASFDVIGLIPTLLATPIGAGTSANEMAQSLAGQGVTVSNVKYTGAPAASGTFRTGFVPDDSGVFFGDSVSSAADPDLIGFPSGIVLSSGLAQNITGRNVDSGITGSNGLPGDPELDDLSKFATEDASVLEFDFVPTSDTVAFQYVFASDEYNEFVNSSFNDVFAFEINDKNCAVVPGTTQPVSINTINNGNPVGQGVISNPQFYRDNAGGGVTIEPDGFTTVLKCQAAVTPNQTNQMKLAIADASDSSLDSWVFLAGDSLVSVPQTTTPETTTTTGTTPPDPTLIPATSIVNTTTTAPPAVTTTTTPGRFNGPFGVTTTTEEPGDVDVELASAPEETTPPTVLGSQEERDEPPQRGEDRGVFEDRSEFTESLLRPDDISTDVGLLAQNAGLALLLVLLVMFPAELFNKTYEENHDTIRGWFASIKRFGRKVQAGLEPVMGQEQMRNTFVRTPIILLGFAGVTAVLYGMLDPTLGLNKGSAALLVGFLLAIGAVTAVYELSAARFIKRKFGVTGQMRAFPGAMVIAVICIAVSRLVDFAPGYLFGIIAGFEYHGRVRDEDEGKAIAFGAVNMLVLSLVAWLVWGQVDDLVQRSDPHFLLLAVDALLAAVFVAGLEGVIFGLLPLRFLDGEKVLRYSQLVWVTVFGLGMYAFVHILLHPQAGYIPTSDRVSVFMVVALFAGFGLFSMAFWGYFKLREEPADDEEEEEELYLT